MYLCKSHQRQIIGGYDESIPSRWAIVSGLVDRNGQRYSTSGTIKHGGKRVKNTMDKDMGWVEAGALEAMRVKQQITMG